MGALLNGDVQRAWFFVWPVCCFHVSMLLVTKNVILILAEFKFYNSLLFLLRGILTMRKIRIPAP